MVKAALANNIVFDLVVCREGRETIQANYWKVFVRIVKQFWSRFAFTVEVSHVRTGSCYRTTNLIYVRILVRTYSKLRDVPAGKVRVPVPSAVPQTNRKEHVKTPIAPTGTRSAQHNSSTAV